MGFRVLLIAVTGKEPATIYEQYGVAPTGKYEEVPESPVTGTALPVGGYLLYVNDEILPDDRVLGRLSEDAALLACYANETVMNSFACGWVGGVELWSVFHDAQQGIQHLETAGDLPGPFDAIRERLLAEQDDAEGVDCVFDVPVELFAALGGIRYNEQIEGAAPQPWQVLARIQRKSGWRRWWPFG